MQTKDIKVGEDYAAYPYYRRRRHYMDEFRIRVKVLETGVTEPKADDEYETSYDMRDRQRRSVKVRVVKNPSKHQQYLGPVRSVSYIEPRMIEMTWPEWEEKEAADRAQKRQWEKESRDEGREEVRRRKALMAALPPHVAAAPMVVSMIDMAATNGGDNPVLSLDLIENLVGVVTGELPSAHLMTWRQQHVLKDATFVRLGQKESAWFSDDEEAAPLKKLGLVRQRHGTLVATAKGEAVARAVMGDEYDFDDTDEED